MLPQKTARAVSSSGEGIVKQPTVRGCAVGVRRQTVAGGAVAGLVSLIAANNHDRGVDLMIG
jgi:hypothetical protein